MRDSRAEEALRERFEVSGNVGKAWYYEKTPPPRGPRLSMNMMETLITSHYSGMLLYTNNPPNGRMFLAQERP